MYIEYTGGMQLLSWYQVYGGIQVYSHPSASAPAGKQALPAITLRRLVRKQQLWRLRASGGVGNTCIFPLPVLKSASEQACGGNCSLVTFVSPPLREVRLAVIGIPRPLISVAVMVSDFYYPSLPQRCYVTLHSTKTHWTSYPWGRLGCGFLLSHDQLTCRSPQHAGLGGHSLLKGGS